MSYRNIRKEPGQNNLLKPNQGTIEAREAQTKRNNEGIQKGIANQRRKEIIASQQRTAISNMDGNREIVKCLLLLNNAYVLYGTNTNVKSLLKGYREYLLDVRSKGTSPLDIRQFKRTMETVINNAIKAETANINPDDIEDDLLAFIVDYHDEFYLSKEGYFLMPFEPLIDCGVLTPSNFSHSKIRQKVKSMYLELGGKYNED